MPRERPEPSRAAPAARAPPGRETNPAAPPRYGLPDGHAAPPPPRGPRYNLPTRCDAPPARISIQPASDGASTSRPAGYNDGHGAAGSRRVADGPDAGCERLPNLAARDRGSPHGPDLEPRPRSVHRPDAAWRG